VGDNRRTPARVIAEAPQRSIFRYLPGRSEPSPGAPPVLLVPPLAAPATCFDLRRGCSVAEHMLSQGRRTYLLDYGPVSLSNKDLGLEHWIDDVLPPAIETVAADSGAGSVQLVGWCLGGIMAMLTLASHRLPVSAVAMVASPFDFATVRLLNPIRRIGDATGGRVVGTAVRALGQAPGPLVETVFKLSSLPVYLKKPVTLVRRSADRDFLAHIEAVDLLMGDMYAYPGRTMNQLYHRFFRANELAAGKLTLGERVVDVSEVDVPLLNVAGATDVLAPTAAVHHLGAVATGAPEVRLETAPGGHLGVLTGPGARRETWPLIDAFLAEAATARPA
jgi:polyhydroxyalkanoate synthase